MTDRTSPLRTDRHLHGVSYLLANERFVVSERGLSGPEEQAFAAGVAFAPYEALVDTCVDFLRRPDERRRIAAAGAALMSARPARDVLAAVVGEAWADTGHRPGRGTVRR